jgi:hypothetical protein
VLVNRGQQCPLFESNNTSDLFSDSVSFQENNTEHLSHDDYVVYSFKCDQRW